MKGNTALGSLDGSLRTDRRPMTDAPRATDMPRPDIRVGTITDARPSAAASGPGYGPPGCQLWIDFGPRIGIKQSTTHLSARDTPETLIGRQVCAVINVPQRQIGSCYSEVLTLDMPDKSGEALLIRPDHTVPDGGMLF